jgi:hypothetical protein
MGKPMANEIIGIFYRGPGWTFTEKRLIDGE